MKLSVAHLEMLRFFKTQLAFTPPNGYRGSDRIYQDLKLGGMVESSDGFEPIRVTRNGHRALTEGKK